MCIRDRMYIPIECLTAGTYSFDWDTYFASHDQQLAYSEPLRFHEGIFTDYDLEGAYSTALAGVVEPDFENLKATTDPSDFTLDQMGFALVSWKFPRGTRFPCLFQ